jgi:hypothetical protein
LRTLRRIFLAIAIFGAVLLATPREASFDTGPFPGAGLSEKMLARVTTAADYYLRLSMPKPDQALGLSSETISCSVALSLTRPDTTPIQAQISSFSRYGEFGFGRIQYYRGSSSWHLAPGEYTIEITGLAPCNTVMTRGGTLSLEQEMTHLTERYLWSMLRHWIGIVCLSGGFIGLIVLEFARA